MVCLVLTYLSYILSDYLCTCQKIVNYSSTSLTVEESEKITRFIPPKIYSSTPENYHKFKKFRHFQDMAARESKLRHPACKANVIRYCHRCSLKYQVLKLNQIQGFDKTLYHCKS